jgi:alginate O-acetyltransferase complex protein AlgJ
MNINRNHKNHQACFNSIRELIMLLAVLCCLCPLAASGLDQSSTNSTLPTIPPSLDNTNPSYHMGNNGWWFLSSELKHLQTATETTGHPDNTVISAIGDFDKYLNSLGIQLLVVPIPEKSLVRMDQILPTSDLQAGKNYSQATGRYISALSAAGVDVLDLSNQLIAEVASESTHGDPVYCKNDSHYTSRTANLIATWICEHVKKSMPQLIQNNDASPILGSKKEITIQGDLCQKTPETLQVVEVTSPTSSLTPNATPKDSAMVLMGDSHCLVFSSGGDMLAKGAGLPDYLGMEFGTMPTLVAQRGGAKNSRIEFIRKSRKNKDFLGNVKLVVWCFAARELTQGDKWSPLQYPR